MRHYFVTVRPECLTLEGYTMPAYMSEVRERQRRLGLTELRTGVHSGAEERARLLPPVAKPPLGQRYCEHCARAGLPGRVENTHHIIFDCVLYADLRALHPELFPGGHPQPEPPSLAEFLSGAPAPLARYAEACRRRGRRALGMAL